MRLELSLNNSGNKKATLDERLFGKAASHDTYVDIGAFYKTKN